MPPTSPDRSSSQSSGMFTSVIRRDWRRRLGVVVAIYGAGKG